MALTRTTKLQTKSSAEFGYNAFTTSAFTPSNNSLLVVAISALEGAGTSEMASGVGGLNISIDDVGADLTWTTRVTTLLTEGGWGYGTKIFTAPVTTGVSMTIVADVATADIHDYFVEVYQYTGYDTGSPVGGSIVGTDADGDGAASITLSSTPAADSDVLAFAILVLNTSGTPNVTEGAGWTELADQYSDAWAQAQSQARTGSTSTTVAWADLQASGGGASGAALSAIEIKAAAGGGTNTGAGTLRGRFSMRTPIF